MKMFTVVGDKTVWRYPATSIQQLTQQLRREGVKFQAIHEDKESTK